jgi:NAD(P)H-hydrate epimerase
MKILTASEMAEVDRRATADYGMPSIVLMENAGRSVAQAILEARPDVVSGKLLIVCGKGNNGGDGMVAARHLEAAGARPEIVLVGDPAQLSGDARASWRAIRKMGLPVHVLAEARGRAARLRKLERADVLVDALFGTGLTRPLGRPLGPVVDWINGSGAFVVAVDLPSGVRADSGEDPRLAVRADLTVTFAALKPALVLPPACGRAGRVVVATIGAPRALVESPEHRMELVDAGAARRMLPPRPLGSHKGDFGNVQVVAGSRGKSGAALMTGLAALRAGAGLVTVWLPERLHGEVVGKVPELMTGLLPETEAGSADAAGAEKVLAALEGADAVAIGPGLTVEPSTRRLVRHLVRASPVPVVLDADGINAFAGDAAALANDARQPIVITPHPGEMARLVGTTVAAVERDRVATARDFAQTRRVFTILKGYRTIVASPGGRVLVNSTGNPGMATAGSGDVLTGIVARFAAVWRRRSRGRDPESLADALAAAVYLHGLAGDLAASDKGMESMIATDLLPHLPEAFKATAPGGP